MADFKDFQKVKWYYQILIVGGICGALLGGFWYQFLTPFAVEIEGKQKELKKVQGEVDKARQLQQQYARFKAETAQLQVKLEALKKVLPLEKETDDLLREVQAAVSTSGMRLLSFRPRNQADRDVYLEWPIDMEIVGQYHDVGRYLDKIRQLSRIVNITNLRVQSRAGSGDPGSRPTVGATYVATTFIYKEEPPPPPTAPAKAAPAKAPAKAPGKAAKGE